MQIGSCRTKGCIYYRKTIFLEEVDRTIRLGAKPNQIKIYDDVDILLIDDLEEIFETAKRSRYLPICSYLP